MPSVTDRLLIVYGILLQHLSLLQQLCKVDNGIFLYGWRERHSVSELNKKLSYRRGTARCVLSIEICQFQRNSAETTYSTSPDQIDGMKLEI